MASDAHEVSNPIAEKWMREAIEEAKLAIEEGEVPVGAVFVRHPRTGVGFDFSSGEVIARGHNQTNRTRNVR
jgi:tRNA(Arg) A34 adenosine deaminase TadA